VVASAAKSFTVPTRSPVFVICTLPVTRVPGFASYTK
jgi:hypothetical protein